MKKSLLSLGAVTVFTASVFLPSYALAAPCAPGLVFYDNMCVTPAFADAIYDAKKKKPNWSGIDTQKVVTKRKTAKKVQSNRNGGSDRSDDSGSTEPPTPGSSATVISNNPPDTSTPAGRVLAKTPKPKPDGDIQVITYLKGTGTKPENKRIGNVKVHINKTGGDESCNTHSNNKATTNAKQYITSKKNNKKLLVKGTANFIGCNTGEYTVTVDGRSGYKLADGEKSSKKVTIQDDKTTEVKFVLVKDAPAKKKK